MVKKHSQSKNKVGRPKDLEKHATILEAAGKLFLKQGFERVSMDAIAKEADVSKLTIYSHFEDKEALFKEVILHRSQLSSGTQDFTNLKNASLYDIFCTIGEKFLEIILSKEAISMHRILIAESVQHPKIAKMFYEACPLLKNRELAALLDKIVQEKRLTITDTTNAAEHFFSLLKGDIQMKMMLNLIAKPTTEELRNHIDSCVKLFLKAFSKTNTPISL